MFGLKVEKRSTSSFWIILSVSIFSVGLALLISSIIVSLVGFNPIRVYSNIFVGAFGNLQGIARTVTKTIPLLLVSIGLSFAFKAKAWNIGAPGQMVMGAIAGSGVALFLFPNLPAYFLLPLMFVAGFIAGAGFAAVCAFLNDRIGLDMVISTLLLNYVAFKFLGYLLYGPWQKTGLGFPYTAPFPDAGKIPTLWGTGIHYPTLILGLVVMVFVYIILSRTSFGYEIRVFGENRQAAEYAGISSFKVIMFVMIISGGLAGMAGVGEAAGVHYMLKQGVTGAGGVYVASYGYTAIFIAWLGRNNPIGAGLASFFVAGILVGGQKVQLIGLPYAMVPALLGLMLMILMGGAILIRYKISIRGGES